MERRRTVELIFLSILLLSSSCVTKWGDHMPPREQTAEANLFSAWYDSVPESRVRPDCPHWTADAGVEGYVVMELDISRQGEVTGARVVESKPLGVYNYCARQSALQLRYIPKKKGEPDFPKDIRYRITFTVR